MYIVERHNCKDSVAVYDSLSAFSLLAVSPTHRLSRLLPGADTVALQRVPAPYPIGGLSVSPSPIKPYFAIFAQALEYALSIHLPPMARPVASLPPSEGESHTEWSSIGLGVRSAEWRPGGGWLAVAGWDGRVRLSNPTLPHIIRLIVSCNAQIRLIDDREWSTILTLEPMRMTPPSAVSQTSMFFSEKLAALTCLLLFHVPSEHLARAARLDSVDHEPRHHPLCAAGMRDLPDTLSSR